MEREVEFNINPYSPVVDFDFEESELRNEELLYIPSQTDDILMCHETPENIEPIYATGFSTASGDCVLVRSKVYNWIMFPHQFNLETGYSVHGPIHNVEYVLHQIDLRRRLKPVSVMLCFETIMKEITSFDVLLACVKDIYNRMAIPCCELDKVIENPEHSLRLKYKDFVFY